MNVPHGPQLAPALHDSYLILQDFRQELGFCRRSPVAFAAGGDLLSSRLESAP